MRPSFEFSDFPALESGLVADWTSGSFFSAETVSSIGVLYFESLSLAPLGAVRTTGLVPLACDGKRFWRRLVACWLSVPGSVRLSLTSEPTLRAHAASATKITIQTPRTIQRRRTQKPPRP
jgi:hypothetical protein